MKHKDSKLLRKLQHSHDLAMHRKNEEWLRVKRKMNYVAWGLVGLWFAFSGVCYVVYG